MVPRSSEVVEVTRQASIQFAAPFRFRVIRVHDWPTYAGWLWLDGYQLDPDGDAVARRSIYVRAAGLRPVTGTAPAAPSAPAVPPEAGRQPGGPLPTGRVPRQRTHPQGPISAR
jgi:hypothetical protein